MAHDKNVSPMARFPSWESAVLVRAALRDYLGVTEVLPIYEELEDGAEIAWQQRSPRTLRKLKELVGDKESFFQ